MPDVYIRAYPDGSGLRQVSPNGGMSPYWTKGGREIVYLAGRGPFSVMAVEVAIERGALTLGNPEKLFDVSLGSSANAQNYHAAADGNRFAALLTVQAPQSQQGSSAGQSNVVLIFNLFEELRTKVARRR